MDMGGNGEFSTKNLDMDVYESYRTGWSGKGLKILPREGLYTQLWIYMARVKLGLLTRPKQHAVALLTLVLTNAVLTFKHAMVNMASLVCCLSPNVS